MAILPKSGVSYINHVRPSELRAAIVDLKLEPLDADCEREVRFHLNRAVGSWWGQLKNQDIETAKKVFARQAAIYRELRDEPANDTATVSPELDEPANGPATAITVDEVAGIVGQIADSVQFVDEALAPPEPGFHEGLDHRKLEALGYIAVSLDAYVSGSDSIPCAAAHAYLAEFRERARLVIQACQEAQTKLDMHRGKRGPAPHDWFDPVTTASMLICQCNGIKATISTDRITDEKGGRFLLVTERIVQLLPKAMRLPTRGALAKKLAGSRKRLREARQSQLKPRRKGLTAPSDL